MVGVARGCVQMDRLMWLDVDIGSVVVRVGVSSCSFCLSEYILVQPLAQFLTGFALYKFSLLLLLMSIMHMGTRSGCACEMSLCHQRALILIAESEALTSGDPSRFQSLTI